MKGIRVGINVCINHQNRAFKTYIKAYFLKPMKEHLALLEKAFGGKNRRQRRKQITMHDTAAGLLCVACCYAGGEEEAGEIITQRAHQGGKKNLPGVAALAIEIIR